MPPRRVRIYRRQNYHLLQWWDKGQKRTLSERVDGDLVEAVSQARRIDERLEHFRTNGARQAPCGPREMVKAFTADLARRADAGEIDVATVRRYESAIERYLSFAEQPEIKKRYPHAGNADRNYQLGLSAFLSSTAGSASRQSRRQSLSVRGQQYVLDVVRGMYQWAADPKWGNLLLAGFRNPFVGSRRRTDWQVVDPVQRPDIDFSMATDLINSADRFQLSILSPLLLFGLRPAELGWLFREKLDKGWLRVACVPELDYLTKGRRDKRFPVPDCLHELWNHGAATTNGLLYTNRRVAEGHVRPSSLGNSLAEMSTEYRRRIASTGQWTAPRKRRERTAVMRAAGQLEYDHVEREFRKLSKALQWPAAATLKDLRHLFATCLEDSGVPEFYRRYFMGHSPGRDPIVVYTHLSEEKLHQYYKKTLATELAPIVAAIEGRLRNSHHRPAGEAEPIIASGLSPRPEVRNRATILPSWISGRKHRAPAPAGARSIDDAMTSDGPPHLRATASSP